MKPTDKGTNLHAIGLGVQLKSSGVWGDELPHLKVSSMSDLMKDIVATKYMIKGIIVEDSSIMLYGSSMALKSFIAFEMAHCIATGRPFMGCRVCQTGKVLVIAGEGKDNIRKRFKAISDQHGYDGTENIDLCDEAFNLGDKESMLALERRINAGGYSMVIFDTFSSLAGGKDENSAKDVSEIMQNIRAICAPTKTSSMIIHHSGKNKDAGMRGSSAFQANVDTVIMADRQPGSLTTMICCEKMKDGRGFDKIPMQAIEVGLGVFDDEGQEETSLYLEPMKLGKISLVCEQNGKQSTAEVIKRTMVRLLAEVRYSTGKSGDGVTNYISKKDLYAALKEKGVDGRVQLGRMIKDGDIIEGEVPELLTINPDLIM